jgi:hypothetical protein
MSAQKTYEQRLADLVRLLASNQEGEVLAATRALGRLLDRETPTSTISPRRSNAWRPADLKKPR